MNIFKKLFHKHDRWQEVPAIYPTEVGGKIAIPLTLGKRICVCGRVEHEHVGLDDVDTLINKTWKPANAKK